MPPCATNNTTPTGSRCCSARMHYGKALVWAGSKGASAPGLLPRSVGDLLLRDPLQLEWPYRGGRRYGASAVVPVHALHRYRRQSGDVARQHRSRDLCAGGWRLDVPPQAVGAADECAVRDWLSQDAFHVTRRNGG